MKSDALGLAVSEQTVLREGVTRALGHDEVIENPDIQQGQARLEPLGNPAIR